MNILLFKKVKEIADNSGDFTATVESPWNPNASFAVYQKESGWTEDIARKHFKLCKCKGEFRLTASGNGYIGYMNAQEDNSSTVSADLAKLLQAGTA